MSFAHVIGKKAKKQFSCEEIMNLLNLKDSLKDYAKDIRLNIEGVLSEEGAPGLSQKQIAGLTLACAYATKNRALVQEVEASCATILDDAYLTAARSAATIMAMNNVYYRFLHLAEDAEFAKMPAKLRMSVIGKPGIDKFDFEMMSLAVSAIEGCGKCITAHVHELRKAGASNEAIQSSIRIASVVNATSQALFIG
jgi:lipoyl-dependent peroxiredoxin subunit D